MMNVTFGNHLLMFPMNSQYCCLSISKKAKKKSIKTNQKMEMVSVHLLNSTLQRR